MIDLATHWFYAERQLSASAAVERMRHALWADGFYTIWLTLTKPDPPYAVCGLWGQETFEVEFEPRHFLIVRSTTDHERLKVAFTRALSRPPHFQYQDKAGVNIYRMAHGRSGSALAGDAGLACLQEPEAAVRRG